MNERIFNVIILVENEPNLASWFLLNGHQTWRSDNYSTVTMVDTIIPGDEMNLPSTSFRIIKAPGEPDQPRLYRYVDKPITQMEPGWIYRVTTRDTQIIDPQTLISHVL